MEVDLFPFQKYCGMMNVMWIRQKLAAAGKTQADLALAIGLASAQPGNKRRHQGLSHEDVHVCHQFALTAQDYLLPKRKFPFDKRFPLWKDALIGNTEGTAMDGINASGLCRADKARQIVRDPRHHSDQTILDACAVLKERGTGTDYAEADRVERAIKAAWQAEAEADGRVGLAWVIVAGALTWAGLLWWWLT
jgi:hypothetical protein